MTEHRSSLEIIADKIEARNNKYYQLGVEDGIQIGLSRVRSYIDNHREPLLRKILAGEVISQKESERLTVYSELVEELESMRKS